MRNILSFLLLVVLMESCSDDAASLQDDINSCNPIYQAIHDFYLEVTPSSSRNGEDFTITAVHKQHYDANGNVVNVIHPDSRYEATTLFDLVTVEFTKNGVEGYSVLSEYNDSLTVHFFTEHGLPSDTTFIDALNEYFSILPQAIIIDLTNPEKHICANKNCLAYVYDNCKYEWGQGYPFNIGAKACDCETCNTQYSQGHNPIGCVAIAVAQTVATVGQFNGTFYGTKDIDFPSLPKLGSQMTGDTAKVVGAFLHEVALGCQMKFGCSGSGSTIPAAKYFLTEKGYECEYVSGEIDNERLLAELNAGIPHIMAGFKPASSGHAWIITGYHEHTDYVKYYCNWGWNGSSNGWVSNVPFKVSTNTSYSENQQHIYITSTPQ